MSFQHDVQSGPVQSAAMVEGAAVAVPPAPRRVVPAWMAYVVTGFCVLMVVVCLWVVHRAREFGTPAATLEAFHAALAAGDLVGLAGEKAFDFADRVEREIRTRGEAEYQRIHAIYMKQKALGTAEYERRKARYTEVMQRAEIAGRAIFEGKSEDEKYIVWVGKPKARWQFDTVFPSLSAQYRESIRDFAVVSDPQAQAARGRELGMAMLTTDEQTVAARADTDASLAADPHVKRILDKRQRLGDMVLGSALYAYERAVRRIRYRPPYSTEHYNNQRAAERKLGLDSLQPGDRTFVDQHHQMFADPNPEPYYWRLGWDLLDKTEQLQLGGRPYATFVAERDEFIPREGKRLYTAFLTETFSACSYEIRDIALRGPQPRGLLRTWLATVKLRWRHPDQGLVATYQGVSYPTVEGLDVDELRRPKREPGADRKPAADKARARVPRSLLKPAVAAMTFLWDEAVSLGVLRDGVRLDSTACEEHLGSTLSFRYHRGTWRLVWGAAPPFDATGKEQEEELRFPSVTEGTPVAAE